MPIQTTPVLTGPDGAGPAPDADLVAVPFGPGPDLAPAPWLESPVPVDALLAHYEAKGEPGEVVEVPTLREGGVRRVLLYGTGDGSAAALRKAGAALARRAKGRASLSVVVPPKGETAALAEGALLAAYTFTIGNGGKKPVGEIVFVGGDERDLKRGEAVARATALARDLVNTPSSVKTPAWLAEQAKAIAAESGLGVRVREGAELGEFGGIRAVGQGSVSPPCLVELSYTPENPRAHVVLMRQGHHVRHRRPVPEAQRGHEDDEDRHGRRRRRHRRDERARRLRRAGAGHRPRGVRGELHLRLGAAAGRRHHPVRRAHGRGAEHRRGGSSRAGRRAGVRAR